MINSHSMWHKNSGQFMKPEARPVHILKSRMLTA